MSTNQTIRFWGCLIVSTIWTANGNNMMAAAWFVIMLLQLWPKEKSDG